MNENTDEAVNLLKKSHQMALSLDFKNMTRKDNYKSGQYSKYIRFDIIENIINEHE